MVNLGIEIEQFSHGRDSELMMPAKQNYISVVHENF